MTHLQVLIILLPIAGALLCFFVSRFSPGAGKKVAITCLFFSFVCAGWQLVLLIKESPFFSYWPGGWAPPYGAELAADPVNGVILLVIACISWMTALFSSPFTEKDKSVWFQSAGYYSMLSMLAAGLLGMASTADTFNLYVFMEMTALAGYGLIASGEDKGPIAAFRYLLTGTIGSFLYLLGAGFLYAVSGTLNMADLEEKIESVPSSPLLLCAAACMAVGFGIKMALFPLHGWQPAAHSYAPPAADPIIAGIMIKVPAYALLRMFYCVFDYQSAMMEYFFTAIGLMAVCGVLYGSLKALRYDSFNKLLAYSSIGQVGYIALGFAVGNLYGLIGAVLHIISHAFMKTGLFYVSGALKYKYGITQVSSLGQIYKEMPVTAAALVIHALSMIGLPPLAGFFSKWYLGLGAVEEGNFLYLAALLFSSLLSALYFFRVLESLLMGEKKEKPLQREKKQGRRKGELPWQMILPIGMSAAAVIALGLGSSFLVEDILQGTLQEVFLR